MPNLRVRVIGAKQLNSADMDGKMFILHIYLFVFLLFYFCTGFSDPYCVLRCGSSQQKTKTINKNLNPTWNETFTIQVFNPQTERLEVEVFDHDQVGGDDSLGKGSVILSDLFQGQEKQVDVKLVGGDVGENLMGMVQAQAMSKISGMFGKKKKPKPPGQTSGMAPVSNKGVVTLALTALDFSGGIYS